MSGQFDSLIFLWYSHNQQSQIAALPVLFLVAHLLSPRGAAYRCMAKQAHSALATLADPHGEEMDRSIRLLEFLRDFYARCCS